MLEGSVGAYRGVLVMFGFPGTAELIIIFAILVVLFGAKKVPELVDGLGKSIGGFRRALREGDKAKKELEHGPGDD